MALDSTVQGALATASSLAPPISASQFPPSSANMNSPRPAMTQNIEDQAGVDKAEKDRDKFLEKERPKFPTLAPEPKSDTPNDPIKGYISAIGVLGAIGSTFTRVPMTHSMLAAGAALNAMKANDSAAFQEKFDAWKVQNENALKLYDYQNAVYKDILTAKNKSVDERIAELKANAAAFKDDIMMKLAEDRNPSVIDEHLAKADEARNKLQGSLDKINEWQEKQQHVAEGLDLYQQAHPSATQQQLFAEKTRLQQETGALKTPIKPTAASAKAQKNDEDIDNTVALIDKTLKEGETAQTIVDGVPLAPQGIQGLAAHMAEGIGIGHGANGATAPRAAYKEDVSNIATRASTILRNGRYSAPAEKKLEENLAATGTFTSPETAKSALTALRQQLLSMKGKSKDHSEEEDDPNRELTPEELEEYHRLKGN